MAKTQWMPGMRKLEISWAKNLSRYGTKPKTLVLHIAASTANGVNIYKYFNRTKVAASHFYVDYDGTGYQYQPIKARSGADYGAKHTVSIESQGTTGGKWTKAQLRTIAKIAKWLNTEWGIELVVGEYSDSKGIVGHRHGVDGNFPGTGILRGRLQRGRGPKLSGARGKTCPTDARQAQIPDVVSLAKTGSPVPGPAPKPTPKPTNTKVDVDGVWGGGTTTGIQVEIDAPYKDGEISRQNEYYEDKNTACGSGWEFIDRDKAVNGQGSQTIKLLWDIMKHYGIPNIGPRDGLAGDSFFEGLQRLLAKKGDYTGKFDDYISRRSSTVRSLQRAVNNGSLKKWAKAAGVR